MRSALQLVKPIELTTADDIVRRVESIKDARESTRRQLLSLCITCKELTILIARYDLMLLEISNIARQF